MIDKSQTDLPEPEQPKPLTSPSYPPTLPPQEPPGMPQFAFEVGPVQKQVDTIVADCDAIVTELIGKVQDAVDICLLDCGHTWATCEACVAGKLEDALSLAHDTTFKCLAKLTDKAERMFNEAVSASMPVIGTVPDLATAVVANMMPVPVGPPGGPPIVPPQPAPVIGPPITCPPGQTPVPQSDGAGGIQWTCRDLGFPGGPPQPEPSPTPTPQPKPTCPPGTVPVGFQQGDGSFIWQCLPAPIPPPTPKPVPPVCNVILPPPPPAPPPCPEPTIPCPDGQAWQWNGTAWECKPKPPGTGPTGTKPPGDTLPPVSEIFGLVGVFDWNKCECPSFGFLSGPGSTTQDALNVWDVTIQTGINRLQVGLPQNSPDIVMRSISFLADQVIGLVGSSLKNSGEWAIRQFTGQTVCNVVPAVYPWVERALLGLAEAYLHVGFGELIQSLTYTIDYQCPVKLPQQGQVDAAWLNSVIPTDVWKCWTRANGNLDAPAYCTLWAQRTQPSPQQWIAAWQRDLLPGNDLADRLAGVGVKDPFEQQVFTRLMEQLPGPGDIVRFMLRDVEDPNVVGPFQLDANFAQKFQGLSAQYAKGQGISTELMLRYWRAHWQWPSPSQMYEMVHRLRADALDPNDARLVVTQADVVKVLGINDVIPYFQERLAAIAYRLPRLLDVSKFFEFGLWGEPRLLDYFQSYGYKIDDAKSKVDLIKQQTNEKEEKAAYVMSKAKAVAAFVSGVAGELELEAALTSIKFSTEQIQITVSQAVQLRAWSLRKKLLKSIKCQFVNCAIDSATAVSLLIQNGWAAADAAYEISCWKQQCAVKQKEVTAATLCKWFGDGFISVTEYRSRLRRLGFSRDDVERIIGECIVTNKKAASKAAGSSTNGTAAISTGG